MKDETFMKAAFTLAEESKCCSIAVCALFVKDGRIISTGINGSIAGHKNCIDHAKEMGWLETESNKSDAFVDIGFITYRGNAVNIHQVPVPYGATHAIEVCKEIMTSSNNHDLVRFVKVDGADVYHLNSKNEWLLGCTSYLTLKEIKKFVWQKGSNRIKSIKGRVVLNQQFREQHHAWSNEHEIHAEMNGIVFAAKNGVSLEGSTMYVTHTPCGLCVKVLAQLGIVSVVYSEIYDKNPANWANKLTDVGIEVKQVKVKL